MEAPLKYKKEKCHHSEREYQLRVKRGFFVKTFLFWLPVKRYLCGTCLKHYYVYSPKPIGHHHTRTVHAHE